MPSFCSGASVNVKNTYGCSFLHLAILQPKGLKNIPEEVLQVRLSYVSLLQPIYVSNLDVIKAWIECNVSLMNAKSSWTQIS